MFRGLASVVVPVLLLGGLEVGLRVGGYGRATSFLLPRRINGTDMLVDNTWFGLRFFPAGLARSPSPVAIPARKEPGVYRIFLFGESAALGDPRPAYGMGRYLEVLLNERHPGARFEVVCLAMTAINSHAVLSIARECARYQGDLWVVYMGNNEFAGPFGANTIFGPRALPAGAVRFYLAAQQLRLGQLILALTRSLRGRFSPPATWGGMRMFMGSQLPPSDQRKQRVYSNFSENVAAIIQAAKRAGVPVVLSSVASNLKDCAPFASAADAAAGPGERTWKVAARAGLADAEQGRWPEAVTALEEAARLAPQHAEVRFQLADALAATGAWPAARKEYALARDLDALPFRADSTLNNSLEQAAAHSSDWGVVFADPVKRLSGVSSNSVPGREIFLDHVHLRPEGNYEVARCLAEQIESRLPKRLIHGEPSSWATPAVCAQRLGLTDWNRYSILEEISQRLDEAPFTHQLHHAARIQWIQLEMQELRARSKDNAVAEARAIYQDAITRRPRDYWLHHGYAEFLTSIGDLQQAAAEMTQVRDLLPHHYAAYLQLGQLMARQKQYAQATESFQKALEIRPDLAQAYLELGQIEAAQGKNDRALEQYAQAQRYRPDDPTPHILKARAFDQQNRTADAVASLREALRLRPANWQTRYQLALHLTLEHQFQPAEAELREVARLQPGYGPAHLNLGFVLAHQNRFEEALAEFRETLRLEPHNAQAREFLRTVEQLRNSGSAPPTR